ncbi:7936_t:CDS:2, partial [Racocetra fulgida]
MIIESDLENLNLPYFDINQLKVIKRIGSGAFADVYQAELANSNLKNLKCTALKVFRPFEESEASRKAILKEIASHKKVGADDKVIQLYGFTKMKGYITVTLLISGLINVYDSELSYALVLEFADNGTLRNYLQKNPDLTDFGLSRCLTDASKTTTWLAGYLAYIDPHSLKNSEKKSQKLNKEYDIYSLGVLLWEISSLHPPFDGQSKNDLYIQILNGCRETPILGTPQQYLALYT